MGRGKEPNKQLDHRLTFETAKLVFDDPLAATRHDPHPDGDRWQTVGLIGSVTVFVIHTWPKPDGGTGTSRTDYQCSKSNNTRKAVL